MLSMLVLLGLCALALVAVVMSCIIINITAKNRKKMKKKKDILCERFSQSAAYVFFGKNDTFTDEKGTPLSRVENCEFRLRNIHPTPQCPKGLVLLFDEVEFPLADNGGPNLDRPLVFFRPAGGLLLSDKFTVVASDDKTVTVQHDKFGLLKIECVKATEIKIGDKISVYQWAEKLDSQTYDISFTLN